MGYLGYRALSDESVVLRAAVASIWHAAVRDGVQLKRVGGAWYVAEIDADNWRAFRGEVRTLTAGWRAKLDTPHSVQDMDAFNRACAAEIWALRQQFGLTGALGEVLANA
jgi:hypothetical protein